MFISDKASRIRQKEAQNARDNRLEIVKALSIGQITRRDLYKWGLLTVTGAMAWKHGLNPLVKSAYANVPTGTPRSPLFGAQKFSTPLPRLSLQTPFTLTRDPATDNALWPAALGELPSRRLSYHTEFTNLAPGGPARAPFINPVTGRGPIEGRPPGEVFAHQRWDEFFPQVGYIMSIGQIAAGSKFHPNFVAQDPNSVWTYGTGRFVRGTLPPFLIKGRYGQPILTRIYQNLPTDRNANNGFGRNETQLHFHNAHNGAESDGAANVHHFPGTFYDYRWSTTLARRDKINTLATEPRASGPDGHGGLINVAGDFREIQGTMWAHDHRFFFTADNVYKGNLGMINYYSGPDRGNESHVDGINLRLPSGSLLDYGNIDFDVNLIVSDSAFSANGQYFFDAFDTDGFLGDVPLVNFAYAPFMNVLPRKYRFRILNACMSRFLQLQFAKADGTAMQFLQICNDGNLFVNPIPLTSLDQQGIAERYDIIIDFSTIPVGSTVRMVNTLKQTDGRKPDGQQSLANALAGDNNDPMLGPNLRFNVVSSVQSVDVPGFTYTSTMPDPSQVPATLTEQIPIVAPVRTRLVEFGRAGNGDSRQPNGQCIPDCAETATFPWTIKVNGQAAHSMNANRISELIPQPGQIEHWTYVNGGGGWDHPIHLHFEEGITMNRGNQAIPNTELLKRKDVWRLRPSGTVTFQVQFGEYGGSYVNHCHNTVHEDFAMLMRIQLLTGVPGSPQTAVTPTPNPSPDGVTFTTPEILPEGDPRT
jgi:FtsP/CotA-like multicopper oxidase with cupredoxin domain